MSAYDVLCTTLHCPNNTYIHIYLPTLNQDTNNIGINKYKKKKCNKNETQYYIGYSEARKKEREREIKRTLKKPTAQQTHIRNHKSYLTSS